LADLHLGPKGHQAQPRGRVGTPLGYQPLDWTHKSRPPHQQNYLKGHSADRFNVKIQLQTYPQIAGSFASVVDRVDVCEYHRSTENGRFLTGH
jgi:hypothetical protein